MPSAGDFCRTHFKHFNAAALVDAADGYVRHVEAGGKMLVTLAGAMSTAELSISLAELIRRDKVHAICCTGANLEEDLFNLVAHSFYERVPHYRDLTPRDEQALLERHMNRVTDTCIPELEAPPLLLRPGRVASSFSMISRNPVLGSPAPTPPLGKSVMHSRIHRRFASLVLVLAGLTGSACGDDTEAPATNTPPALTGPTTTVGQSAPGEAVALTLEASDADGDTLTYAWVQTPASPAGTFSSTTVASPSWTAPAVTADQRFTLSVTVTDGKGGSTEGSVDVNVIAPPVNRPPTVDATITAPATLLAGGTGTFSVTASDPDGDTLTYAWEQQAPATQGTWVGALTGSSAQWYSPAVAAQTSFTLAVSVTDGKSAPVVRTVTVPVTVPRYTDIQSVWSVCTSCHGSGGGLSLAAANSYANLVNVTTRIAACNTLSRVKPGDPDASSLVRKLEGTTCGTRMPRNNTTYFNDNPGLLVRVRSWILAGANND